MKRLYLFGPTLVAIFAFGATAASASELTILPTPSVAQPVNFHFKSKEGEKTLLETKGGKRVECNSVSGTGRALSARLGKIKFVFLGCVTALIIKCLGLDDLNAGEILFEAEWHLRHLLTASEGVALVVLLEHVHFTCAGILFLVLGCVASGDLLTEPSGRSIVELLVSMVFANFRQNRGVQEVVDILNDKSEKDEACFLEVKEEAKEYEQAGQLGAVTINEFSQNGQTVILLVHLK